MRHLLFLLSSTLLFCGCSSLSVRTPESTQASTAPVGPSDLILLPPDSPKLARIHSAEVRMRDFAVDELLAPGEVEANANRVSRIVMPVPGRVRQVLVKLGDSVNEGEPLVAIDSPEVGAAVSAQRQAQAQLRQAQSSLRKAQNDVSRLRDLYEHRAAPLKELQAAENDLAQAQAAIEQSQAAVDDTQHRLEVLGLKPGITAQDLLVRAPVAGKVIEISVVPGEYRNDTNATLLVTSDLRTVWITADVPESSISKVNVGEGIQVDLSAYPGEVFRARVTRIADAVDPQSRTIKVQAEIQNPGGRLRPEMFGQIRHSHGLQPLPAVPIAAILQKEGRTSIIVEQSPGRFRETAVTLGARAGDWQSVTAGVKDGERVVVDGAILLRKN